MATVTKNERSNKGGWLIDYYDLSGTRRRKIVHCTRKEADIIAQEIAVNTNRIRLGLEAGVNKNMTIPEAIKYYFSRRSKAEKTIDRENWVYKAFIKYVGPIKIGSINQVMMIEYFKSRKEKDGLTDAGIGIEFRTFRAFFNFLIDQNYLKDNPLKGVKVAKPPTNQIRYLNEDEIRRLIKVLENEDIIDVVLFYINTGARAREIDKKVFTWENVNFKERKITIFGKGKKYRTIPMNDIVYKVLSKRKARDLEVPFSMDYDYIYKRVKKGYKEAGIKNAKLHDLRKTFGSLLNQKGVNMSVIRDLMGHESIKVTEQFYASLKDENLIDGVQQLNDLKF